MIPLIKSTFYKEKQTKKSLNKFIKDAKILSFGKECQKFEKEFAKYQGRKHCVFVNSGSSANLALIQALINLKLISKDNKVATSAVTWSTNVMPLIQHGLNVVPIDVELNTLNLSSKTLIESLKHYRFKVVFITNLLGLCDDLDKIAQICRKNNIILLEDNCESLGSIYKKKKLGNFGLASTFSFYVGHHMSTIEGGAICTDDDELATMLRIVRAHGWDRNLSHGDQKKIRNNNKVNSTFYSRYTFYNLGYNLRPTEINGYLGQIQLKYLDEINKKRNKFFSFLAEKIYISNDYYPIEWHHMSFFSAFSFPIICKTSKIRKEKLRKCNGLIETRPIVGGDMTSQPFLKKHLFAKGDKFNPENAKKIHKLGFYIGINPDMTQSDLNIIAKILS